MTYVTDLPELADLRHSIDNIDAALIHMLAERFKLTQSVGRLKAERGLPPSDPDRERVQVARLRTLAEAAHLDPERRRHLYAEVLALKSQAWFTGTEAELFRPLQDAAQFFTLRDARIQRNAA